MGPTTAAGPPSSNGHAPPAGAAEVMERVRERPRNVLVLRGFGTLVAGIVLFVLMLLLAPSVAPEHIVERPVSDPTTTTTTKSP